MNWMDNPFNELYVTENIPSEHFVRLFSPYLIKSASELFMRGNVVLAGAQGSGKSMLLTLLKPEIRLAYIAANEPYPIPHEYQRVISANINLTTSGARSFSNFIGTDLPGRERDFNVLPYYFADFVNYWIVLDLIRAIRVYVESAPRRISNQIGLSTEKHRLDSFAEEIAAHDCWFGYLDGVTTLKELQERAQRRIQIYKRFLALNMQEVPIEIDSTKTIIGEPISEAVAALWDTGVLEEDVNVFVNIDQYEELYHIDDKQNGGIHAYLQMINKALGQRDRRVSYRIGTRTYAWDRDLTIFGKNIRIELDRDYRLINMDELLRRNENGPGWVFPRFAHEVFQKRLEFSRYKIPEDRKDLILYVFGESASPTAKAKIYAGNEPSKIVREDSGWPADWVSFLKELAINDPLSAKLGEAWARQQGKGRVVKDIPRRGDLPWEKKQWWRKERIQQALMQIASSRNQALQWFGKDDVMELSGGNILVFVSLCQRIWNVWMRTMLGLGSDGRSKELPAAIRPELQVVGVKEASQYWFNKIAELPGGHSRQRFIKVMGYKFNSWLLNDIAMSYPGHNGFSVTVEELDANPNVKDFLNDAVDFSDLVGVPHTTKEKNRRPRFKWYLKPILCPHFKIPHIRTKEPKYVKIADVIEWLIEADVLLRSRGKVEKVGGAVVKGSSNRQLNLFDK